MTSMSKLLLKAAVVTAMGAAVWAPQTANAAIPCDSQVYCSEETSCADLDQSICDDCGFGIIFHCDATGPGGVCDGYRNYGYCGFAT